MQYVLLALIVWWVATVVDLFISGGKKSEWVDATFFIVLITVGLVKTL